MRRTDRTGIGSSPHHKRQGVERKPGQKARKVSISRAQERPLSRYRTGTLELDREDSMEFT